MLSELRVAQVAPSIFGCKYLLGLPVAQTRLVLTPLFLGVVAVAFVALESLEPSRDFQVLPSLKAFVNSW